MRCLLAAPQLHALELTPRNMTLAPEHMHILGAPLLTSLQPAESLLHTSIICMFLPLLTLDLTLPNMTLTHGHMHVLGARVRSSPSHPAATLCTLITSASACSVSAQLLARLSVDYI
jgi:hypothetical protein